MLEEMKTSRDPFVFVDLEFPDQMGRVSLENSGFSPAFHLRIAIDDKISWRDPMKTKERFTSLEEGIAYLAPGRRLLFNAGYIDWKDGGVGQITMKVDYENASGKTFSETFCIDTTHLEGLLFESFRDPSQAIADSINKGFRMIDSRLKGGPITRQIKKVCPFCAELIPKAAKKCSQCGELLSVDGEEKSEDNYERDQST